MLFSCWWYVQTGDKLKEKTALKCQATASIQVSFGAPWHWLLKLYKKKKIYIFFFLKTCLVGFWWFIKAFSKPLCPVHGGLLILKETISIRIEMFHHRKKVINQRNSVLICIESSLYKDKWARTQNILTTNKIVSLKFVICILEDI